MLQIRRALSHTKHAPGSVHVPETSAPCIFNTKLSGLRKKRGNAVYQITCNLTFLILILLQLGPSSLKLQYVTVNWVLPFIFVSVLARQYKIFVLDQSWKWYVCSQRACMKDEDHSETRARHFWKFFINSSVLILLIQCCVIQCHVMFNWQSIGGFKQCLNWKTKKARPVCNTENYSGSNKD